MTAKKYLFLSCALAVCVIAVQMEPAQAFPGLMPGFAAYSTHRVSVESDTAGAVRADGDTLASSDAVSAEVEVLVAYSSKVMECRRQFKRLDRLFPGSAKIVLQVSWG